MSKSLLAGVHRFHMYFKVCFLAKALVTNAALMLFELFMDAFNMASKSMFKLCMKIGKIFIVIYVHSQPLITRI